MVINAVLAILAAAGQQPALQALAIILGTFVLEDAATVLAAVRAQEGGISMPLALVSLYAGIVLGDLGLYALGRLSTGFGWIARLVPEQRSRIAADWLQSRVFKVVLAARFLPGMRLPTYTACGFLRADLRQFALAAIVATLAWTSLLFAVGLWIGQFLIDHLGAWRWAGAVGFALTLVLIGRFAARLQGAER
ncbi:MAG: VTT domain-containing protein [Acetobacteraceae bacterium]|nr:VTT domain-containing protein [Acetobacteraceae bacterium]MBV8574563.1 VTT domain-containing protein [Acetobacteraceae bacterium]